MLELHVRELPRHLDDHRAPQPARREHIRLVHARHAPPAAARQLERETRHAGDLPLGVDERVIGLPAVRAFVGLATLAEVETAGQLPDDEHVHALDQVAPERRGVDERGLRRDRPQVREQPEALAQAQERLLGTHAGGGRVPPGTADRAEEHRVGRLAQGQVLVTQGHPVRVDGRTAHDDRRPIHGEAGIDADRVHHLASRGDHLGTDAVPRDGDDAPRARSWGGCLGCGGDRLLGEELLERMDVCLERGLDDVGR